MLYLHEILNTKQKHKILQMADRSGSVQKVNHYLEAPVFLKSAEAEVMRVLRIKGQTSRTEISNITGWSRAKTSQEVNSLIKKGYLVDIGEGISKGGRKPRLLQLNEKLGYVVGVDIGATSLEIALADINGTILRRVAEPTDVRLDPEDVLGRCCTLILDMILAEGCQPGEILGIGLGVPGPVDFARGVLVAPPLMPDWENFPIRKFFYKTFPSAFVVVDNDVNIMALGEQRSGDAAHVDHFLVIKIGTGIGCGIMANGNIHRGNNGCAGDVGHICVDKAGPICRCGNRGCLEAMAAGPAIAENAVQAAHQGKSELLSKMMADNDGLLTPEDVNAACRDGDEAALDVIRASGQMIGDMLAGLVNFFNPSHIFIGGGIANFGNILLVAIKRAVLRRSLPLATSELTINFSRTGSDVGVLGAIMLALEYVFVVEDDLKFSFLTKDKILE
jgi:glucokinase-like ROK family protein